MFAKSIGTIRGWLYTIYSALFTKAIYKNLVGLVKDDERKQTAVFEIGPGCGDNTCILKDTFQGIEYRGIDIDADYKKRLEANIGIMEVESSKLFIGPIEGNFLSHIDTVDERFNTEKDNIIILMVECTMLMPENLLKKKLKVLASQLRSSEKTFRFVFAHTEFYKDTFVGGLSYYVKPYLYYLTSIHFGRPTYVDDFYSLIFECFGSNISVSRKMIRPTISLFGPIAIISVSKRM